MSDSRLKRTLARLTCIALAMFVVTSILPVAAWSAAGGIERVGVIDIGTGDGIIPDATSRRIVTIAGGAEVLSINAFDADRLVKTRSVKLEPWWPQAGLGGRPRVYSYNPMSRQIAMIAYASQSDMNNFSDPHLLTVDIDTFRIVGTPASVFSTFPPGVRLMGLTPFQDGFLVIAQAVPVVGQFAVDAPRVTGVMLARIDREGRSLGSPVVVRGCQSVITNRTQTQVGILGDRVFVGCATAQVATIPVAGVQSVAEVDLQDVSQQRLYFLPGSYATGDVYFDVAARRLLLVGSTAGSPAQSLWVFDLEHRVFVGQVASGDVNVLGAGLDPETGRLYMGIDRTLLVTSGRGLNIPQAVAFDIDLNGGAISAIPFNSSVIIPTRGPGGSFIFVVFRDSLPLNTFAVSRPADFKQLDSLTAEAPQFTADGKAFGLRVHVIGGVNSTGQNALPFGGNYWTNAGNVTGLKDGDRDVRFARITHVHLSADEASAVAVGAERDSNTLSDYATLSETAPIPWDYEESSCRDFGTGTAKPSEAVTGATTKCDFAAGIVEAEANYTGAISAASVSVGSSSSGSKLTRDEGAGLATTIFAEARNIAIGETVRIASIRSEVVVGATGRVGGSKASYTRTIKGVVINGTEMCGNTCDFSEAAAAISDAVGSQIRVEVPLADVLKTKGGAHGHAIRDAWQHQQDIVINNQEETEQQVPALRLIVVNDKTLASRLIIEFAATKADATSLRVKPIVISDPPLIPEKPPVVLPRKIVDNKPPPPIVSPPKHSNPIQKVVRTTGHGWKVLVGSKPAVFVRAVALWMVLLSPGFFALRRRALLRLGRA